MLKKASKAKIAKAILAIGLISAFTPAAHNFAYADTAAELQAKINEKNKSIEGLEKQIRQYQSQIEALGKEADSLSSKIKTLELNRKQLETRIKVTEGQIGAKNLEIQQLGTQIGKKEDNIEYDQMIIKQALVVLDRSSSKSLLETFLSSASLSKAWNEIDSLSLLQGGVKDKIAKLASDKAVLVGNKEKSEKAKAELIALTSKLNDQKKIILTTVAEQNLLLKQTNQSEAAYRQMLAAKQAEALALEKEIEQYESELNLLVNPDQIPRSGSGILKWPLDSVFITQYFGNTDFATANPQIYNGKGHTGIDFRASIGTPVRASLAGQVVGVANTDSYPGCYSYGKWIMVKHANGLSTLYAHLSLQNVSVGQNVVTGQLLGYSGNTGYSTGPHLHFGVYATEGVVIKKFDTSIRCKGAVIPIADYTAYLNPLSYL